MLYTILQFLRKARSLLIISHFLVVSSLSQAETWLTDTLYLENNNELIYTHISPKNDESSRHSFRLLPELTLTQGIDLDILPSSKIALGGKVELSTENNVQQSQALINEFYFSSAIGSHWGLTLGRQKISYSQSDLFQTSLSKNDVRPNPLNNLTYSQGLLATYRLGFIEQHVLINQKTESTNNERIPSIHYQLKLGVPGYKTGPIKFVFSYEEKQKEDLIFRGMIGSATQFPIKLLPGDWQWAFQYAKEFNNQTIDGNQDAWQTSFSWLGFIPQHKLGLLFSHTDQQWNYSDNFNAGEDRIELRYQWIAHQNFNIELAAAQVNNTLLANTLKEQHLNLRTYFSF